MMRFILGILTGLGFGYVLRRWKAAKYNQDRIALYYQRRAAGYNKTDEWVSLGDFMPRVAMRVMLLDHLKLKAGDKVLDIACGAGANFPYIVERIGESGSLVGVDYSAEMLAEAQHLINQHGWTNVRLIQHDAAILELGESFDVVLSTLGMVVIPNYAEAMQRAFAHVRPGGRFGIADLCESQRWYMLPLNILIDVMDTALVIDTTRRPWEMMQPWVEDYRRDDLALGYMYVATGRKPLT